MDTHSLAEGIVRLTQGMQDVAVNVRAIAAEVKALSYASPQKKMYTSVSDRSENQKALLFGLMTPPPRSSSSSSVSKVFQEIAFDDNNRAKSLMLANQYRIWMYNQASIWSGNRSAIFTHPNCKRSCWRRLVSSYPNHH